MIYTIYDNVTGKIIHDGKAPSGDLCLRRITCGRHEIIRGVRIDGSRYYVDPLTEEPRERPSLDLPAEVALPPGAEPVVVLSGLPDGTVVEMRGEPVPVVGGVVCIVPQTTELHVAPPFPWRPADVCVSVEG